MYSAAPRAAANSGLSCTSASSNPAGASSRAISTVSADGGTTTILDFISRSCPRISPNDIGARLRLIPERRRSLIELRAHLGAWLAPLTPTSAPSYYNHSVHKGREQTQ